MVNCLIHFNYIKMTSSAFVIPFQFSLCSHDGKAEFHTFTLNTIDKLIPLLRLAQTATLSDLELVIFPTFNSVSHPVTITALWTPASLLPNSTNFTSIFGAQIYTFGGAGGNVAPIVHACDFSAISPIVKDPFTRNDTPRITVGFLASDSAKGSTLANLYIRGKLNCGAPALFSLA